MNKVIKTKRILHSAIVFLVLCICLMGCGKKNGKTDASESKTEETGAENSPTAVPDFEISLVEKMVVEYSVNGNDGGNKIDVLLEELSEKDEDAGRRWKTIMDDWRSPELGQNLNYGVLPDGLPETDELCLVVLGYRLNTDGTMRDELIERLKVALNCARKYPAAYIVCTGGPTATNNEEATEAGRMAEWLKEQGIAPERIITEGKSLTTAQNAIYTYDILTSDYPSVKKLAIISSDYHIATGELLFNAEAVLRAESAGNEKLEVVSNAAYGAPNYALSGISQAGALLELLTTR